MLFAFPSSPASPAADVIPASPASSAALPAEMKPAGEVASVAPDFAGVFALADAPATALSAGSEGVAAPGGSGETAPAPDHPRPQVPAFGVEGAVPRAARWLKPAAVGPASEPASGVVEVVPQSSSLAVSGGSATVEAIESFSSGRPARAEAETKRAGDAVPPALLCVAPQLLVTAEATVAVPTSFFSDAPASTSDSVADSRPADGGEAESPAPDAQPARGDFTVYSRYTDIGTRSVPPDSPPQATGPASLETARRAMFSSPRRFVPSPESQPVDSSDSRSVQHILSVPSTSAAPSTAPVSSFSPLVSPRTSAIPAAVSGNGADTAFVPPTVAVPTTQSAVSPASASWPEASAQAAASPFAGFGYLPATAHAPAPLSLAPAALTPAPGLAFSPSPDASPAAPFVVSGHETAAIAAHAVAPVPVAATASAPVLANPEGGVQARAAGDSAGGAAVFAAPAPVVSSERFSGSGREGKNTRQNPDKEIKAESKLDGGTEKARGGVTMQSAVVQAFPAAAAPFAGERVDAPFAPAATETPATIASRLVERVAAVADRVEARPAEPVWVRVDLAGEHRVDVKVELRAGRVFADFRTDSEELRTALSQAWDGFVRGREAAGSRWAEPVFSAASSGAAPSSAVAAPSSSVAESQFRPDADSGRQSGHSDRREPPPFWNEATGARSAAPRSAPAVAPVVPVSRPDSSRHLSALA